MTVYRTSGRTDGRTDARQARQARLSTLENGNYTAAKRETVNTLRATMPLNADDVGLWRLDGAARQTRAIVHRARSISRHGANR